MDPTFDPTKETLNLLVSSGIAKARLPWPDLLLKSFLAGAFLSIGALFSLIVAGGSPSLRAENPGLATLLSSFAFPTGFVILTIVNTELFTANVFVLILSTFMRRTTWLDLVRNLVLSYIFNLAGCLFVAGFLCWWSDTLSTDTLKGFAVTQAEGRVNVQWSVNFLRGVGCNWLVGLAIFLSISCKDKHCIANFFLVPIGMFYGTNFGVGKFIYQSVIPVTLGDIVGGAVLDGVFIWFLYGHRIMKKRPGGEPNAGDHLPS
ncbi:Formate/nitrite transporter-domain-containing protein [Aspergillus flavus]|uniref:Formate/nitrite transporter-domain-containing protein n=1 Tax=Aspergillus flavus (strain ATCC 200026 / FGSC A1120 / IAM 13836 / NRRL 3357 / JCM 12722 / SRRC 167) TaxID=332952 RepID=A0A7U2MD43_ASPFN|nr:Formate/nitrite transporter-domain-containing protein [Aspergillus flavus]